MQQTESHNASLSTTACNREAWFAEGLDLLRGISLEEVVLDDIDLRGAWSAFQSIRKGVSRFNARRFAAAQAEFAEALRALSTLGGDNSLTEASLNTYLALAFWREEPALESRQKQAVEYYKLAIETYRQFGRWQLLLEHLRVVAAMHASLEDSQGALDYLRQAAELAADAKTDFNRCRIVSCFHDYSRLLILTGDYDRAQKELERAIYLTQEDCLREDGYEVESPSPESYRLYELMSLVFEHMAKQLLEKASALKVELTLRDGALK